MRIMLWLKISSAPREKMKKKKKNTKAIGADKNRILIFSGHSRQKKVGTCFLCGRLSDF